MARKINMSQLKSKIRQIECKQRQAINNYNRAVRQYNTNIKRAVSEYNSFVRKHNSTVRHNRQIIQQNVRLIQSSSTTYSVTLVSMRQHYDVITEMYNEGVTVTPQQNQILDLVEQEQANSIITANVIETGEAPIENTEDIEIGEKLMKVSQDLNNRWRGAVFSISPHNPDATRHFCTSAREIFTEFIQLKAPDEKVFGYKPDCERTPNGTPTRREKIGYMMRNMEMDASIISFVEADISNILELFSVLSNGTHGEAGKYEYTKLLQVKKRVEQGINFLCAISA